MTPFATGSISFRLYPHNELEAPAIVDELCAQSGLALASGFDGVMTSEHHGGFAGYLPNPLQVAGFVLDVAPDGWAAACPLLLPLRPTIALAEEIAWLDARHPGRVGLGVAAGALPLDFEALEVPISEATGRFIDRLPLIVDMLSGKELGPVAGDPALRRLVDHPIPVLSAVASVTAARRAAVTGAGLLSEGMSPPERVRRFVDAYHQAGGSGTTVAIRRVWLGPLPVELIDQQRAVYDRYAAGAGGTAEDQTVHGDTPDDLAARLDVVWTAAGVDALNLRVHLPGVDPESAREQIELMAVEVLPRLRQLRAGRRP